MRIQDKVVVISGGASGLGFAAARYLVEEKGAKVAILDVNDETGQRAAENIGERVLFVRTDVASDESVRAAVAATTSRFGCKMESRM